MTLKMIIGFSTYFSKFFAFLVIYIRITLKCIFMTNKKINVVKSDANLKSVEEFLLKNYEGFNLEQCKITYKGGKYVVDVFDELWTWGHPKSLTNGLFEFGTVKDQFNCGENDNLETLEGAPKKITGKGIFICSDCSSLKSLKGATPHVKIFDCTGCSSLKSLEGGPECVEDYYECDNELEALR